MSHTGDADPDARDLEKLGYSQKLNRTIGAYTSFALGFSMITITTTIFSLFGYPFETLGGTAIWLWIPVTFGVLLITLVYAHLSARLPVTGYAYQWSSRLVSPHYGWFTGWIALLSFMAGTASIAVAMATIFAGQIWTTPTKGDLELFASVAIVLAVLINIVGIRAATWVNNIGASTEIVGTIGLAIIAGIGLFFFKDKAGPEILFHSGQLSGFSVSLTSIGLAALLPVYTLLRWEGSADLAEETRDPRRTAPRAMLRSVIISGFAGFAVYAIFAMAIPGSVEATLGHTNPIVYLFEQLLGSGLASVLRVVVLISVFSALLANVTVATRMVFSLSRDSMLPGSSFPGRVNERTKTPILAIIVVGLFALIVNFLSSGLITRVAAITAVAYYLVYLLTTLGGLIAERRGKMPEADGYFSLGRWFRPVGIAAILWSLVIIAYATIPKVNHVAAEYTGYALVIGVLWYVFYLRRKLKDGSAGPPSAGLSATPETGSGPEVVPEPDGVGP